MKRRTLILLWAALALSLPEMLACKSTTQNTNLPTASAPSPGASASTKPNAASSPQPLAAKADNPCYVHIWEDENYGDDNDVIYGPGKWNNMRNLPGANKGDWGDEIDSLKVGPTATVTVWEDENFRDNSQTYGPGTEKTNLRGNPDMGDTIDSMEIRCR
jgi:hypothetical protein